MKLRYIWEKCDKNVDNYLLMVESLGLEEYSLTYQLNEAALESYTTEGVGKLLPEYKTIPYTDILYSIGGVATLDIYSSGEKVEYYADIRKTERCIKSLTNP